MSHANKLIAPDGGSLKTSAIRAVDQKHREQPGPAVFCGTESFTCGICCYHWEHCVRTKMSCRTHNWCLETCLSNGILFPSHPQHQHTPLLKWSEDTKRKKMVISCENYANLREIARS